MANRRFTQFFNTLHNSPVLLDCNFVVADTDGTGITSLKGPGVQAVYSHTATTPSAGNPNPVAGTIVVQLEDNYNQFYGLDFAIQSPTSGSALKIDNSALTDKTGYVITTLGDATRAAWIALGVPAGVTPAVGVSFIASSVGAGANTSTSRVMASATAGSAVASIEVLGDPNLSIKPGTSPGNVPQLYGASLILQCRDYAGAAVAPAAGSKLFLSLYLSNSRIVNQGE